MEIVERTDVPVDVLQGGEQSSDAGGPTDLGCRERVGSERAVGRAESVLDQADLTVELGEPDEAPQVLGRSYTGCGSRLRAA